MSKQSQPSNSRATADEQHSVAVIDADAAEPAVAADSDAIKTEQKRHLRDYDRKVMELIHVDDFDAIDLAAGAQPPATEPSWRQIA